MVFNSCPFFQSIWQWMRAHRVCVWRDLLRDNKEWEWEGKEEKIDEGTIRSSKCKKQWRHRLRVEKERGRKSVRVSYDLYGYYLLHLWVWMEAVMHAILAGPLSLCLGNGASPRGPKFGISILCGNGPPFAACHHKIGGFVLARDPPAEWGPVFPLCSMTPLMLSVHFRSLFLWLSLLSRFFSLSRKTSRLQPRPVWKGSFGCSSAFLFQPNEKAEQCHAVSEPQSSPI